MDDRRFEAPPSTYSLGPDCSARAATRRAE